MEFEVLSIVLKDVAAIPEEEVPAEEHQRLFSDVQEVYAIELGEGTVVPQVSRAWCMYSTRHVFHCCEAIRRALGVMESASVLERRLRFG